MPGFGWSSADRQVLHFWMLFFSFWTWMLSLIFWPMPGWHKILIFCFFWTFNHWRLNWIPIGLRPILRQDNDPLTTHSTGNTQTAQRRLKLPYFTSNYFFCILSISFVYPLHIVSVSFLYPSCIARISLFLRWQGMIPGTVLSEWQAKNRQF